MYKTHRTEGSVVHKTHRRCKGKEEGHANAGSSEQLAAASEPERRAPSCRVWNRRFWNILRALTKYVSQRALPPGAPALATHGLNVRCKKTNRAPQRTYLLASVTL